VERVLGLFAKQPVAGAVKTRLAAGSSPEWAAAVARAFLLDSLERLSASPARRVLAYTPADAAPYFAAAVDGRFTLTAQTAGDLGARMRAFFEEQIRQGADQVVLLGTDSPTVPVEFVARAFDALGRADVVLGPATDGGYYLVGCGRRMPPIFDGMTWGHGDVLAGTVARLADGGWRLELLPPWYDVDTMDDWRMLRGHLAAMRRAGVDAGVPHVENLLDRPDGVP
jgi:rSAM/selenodomain-associated transferase 1